MTVYVIIVIIGLTRLPGPSYETMAACWSDAQWWIAQGRDATCHSIQVLEKKP